jgi:hypothetical protein
MQTPANLWKYVKFVSDPTFGTVTNNTWKHIVIGYNGTDMLMYQNGTLNYKLSVVLATANSSLFFGKIYDPTVNYTGIIDEVAIYNRTLAQNEVTDLYNSGSGIFYGLTSNLSVNLNLPTNGTLETSTSVLFNSSYTYNGMNISNATYYIWNSTNGIFNKTTLTVYASKNFSNLTVSGFTLGAYKWNVYACGKYSTTKTICSWGSSGNYTLDFAGAVVGEMYNNVSYETSSEYFTINFSLFPGSNLISVKLIYNGTNYPVSDITNYGSVVELKRYIDIPLLTTTFANQTKQFLWSFVFSNGGLIPYSTGLRNQTIFPINIVYCNDTYRMVALNFTTYNELNPNPKINATFHTAWSFWLGNGSTKKTYAFEDTSLGNSSFKFCISPNQTSLKADLYSEITSTGFYPRTYYLTNASITNVTQEVPLRLINESTGVKFFHTIRDSVTRVSGANVIISKYDVGLGIWVVVGIRNSDSDGKFIEYLEQDKDYSYSISKNGVLLAVLNRKSICEASPCSLDLEISDSASNFWSTYYDSYADNVAYNLSYDKDSKMVTFDFIDISGLANYFRLQVDLARSNQSNIIVCNTSLSATLGQLTCNLTGYSGSAIAKTYISRSPEKSIGIINIVLEFLANSIGKDNGLFFALLIVVVVGLIGAWNPVVGVLFAGIAFIFANIMGFIMMSFTSIILIVLLIIILIVKMGRNRV